MKKTIKTLLLTLLLSINLFSVDTISYSISDMDYTNNYDIEITSYDNECPNLPVTKQ